MRQKYVVGCVVSMVFSWTEKFSYWLNFLLLRARWTDISLSTFRSWLIDRDLSTLSHHQPEIAKLPSRWSTLSFIPIREVRRASLARCTSNHSCSWSSLDFRLCSSRQGKRFPLIIKTIAAAATDPPDKSERSIIARRNSTVFYGHHHWILTRLELHYTKPSVQTCKRILIIQRNKRYFYSIEAKKRNLWKPLEIDCATLIL